MRVERKLIWALGSLLLCKGASAVTAESGANPYQQIVDRNVFGLKPPTPVVVAEPPKTPPPKITLTGISTFGGKRALMKANLPPKPGDQAKEQFLMLKEGQREGEIEVLEIDEKASIVKVNNYGTITNITFEKEPSKPAATLSAAPVVAPPAPRIPPPGVAGGFKSGFSGRTIAVPPGQPVPGGAGAATASYATTVTPPSPAGTPHPAVSPEVQAVIDEIERERLRGQVPALQTTTQPNPQPGVPKYPDAPLPQ